MVVVIAEAAGELGLTILRRDAPFVAEMRYYLDQGSAKLLQVSNLQQHVLSLWRLV